MVQPRQPLGAAVVTLVVVDAVLVLVLAILAVQALRPASVGGDGAANATSATPGAEFATPSRNIACTLGSDSVTCTIAEFSYPAPQVEGCSAVAGHAVTLTTDGAGWVCPEGGVTPGPAASDVEVLPYGESVTVGDVTCASAEAGVTCTEAVNGHSFTLARGGATLD